jgi:hypothetical protein
MAGTQQLEPLQPLRVVVLEVEAFSGREGILIPALLAASRFWPEEQEDTRLV